MTSHNNGLCRSMIQGLKTTIMAFAVISATACSSGEKEISQGALDRQFWVESMVKIVDPVFTNLANNELRKNMPVETPDGLNTGVYNYQVTHLEALGRSFCGIAPWLNLPPDDTEEGKLRKKYADLVIKAISNAVDPQSPDYMPFNKPFGQPLVDAAFLAHGLLRSEDQIWKKFDDTTRLRLIDEFKRSREIKAAQNNWLCFSAIIEAALLEFTGECNMEPIEYALSKHEEWYKGDGWYGDGSDFHFDYYNSYVIQPMLTDVLYVLKKHSLIEDSKYQTQIGRLSRFAFHQERMISPEGAYPMIGRSSGYRFGAFQALSQAALMNILPKNIKPEQVRSALTTVIKRQLVPETFDENGWLQLGFCGHQPYIGESYISTGSCYLCTTVFLPLGLPADDPFWTATAADWTAKKVWNGK